MTGVVSHYNVPHILHTTLSLKWPGTNHSQCPTFSSPSKDFPIIILQSEKNAKTLPEVYRDLYHHLGWLTCSLGEPSLPGHTGDPMPPLPPTGSCVCVCVCGQKDGWNSIRFESCHLTLTPPRVPISKPMRPYRVDYLWLPSRSFQPVT